MATRKILEPRRQEIWKWPAAANFILGGAGSGFYLLAVLLPYVTGAPFAARVPQEVLLLGPLMVACGLAFLAVEAGRPSRGRYLLSRVRTSWMSRETLAAAVFLLVALLDLVFSGAFIRLVAAAAAGLFLLSQGLLVYRSRAVTLWNRPMIVVLFVLSGLAAGSGLLLLLAPSAVLAQTAGLTILLLMLDLGAWLLVRRAEEGRRDLSRNGPLSDPRLAVVLVGVGHLLPATIAALLVLFPDREFSWSLALISALFIFIGSAVMKGVVLLRGGYFRGVVLERSEDVPERFHSGRTGA